MYDDDERTWEVGKPYMTREFSEQGWQNIASRSTCRGDQGEGIGQKEFAKANLAPDTGPDAHATSVSEGSS